MAIWLDDCTTQSVSGYGSVPNPLSRDVSPLGLLSTRGNGPVPRLENESSTIDDPISIHSALLAPRGVPAAMSMRMKGLVCRVLPQGVKPATLIPAIQLSARFGQTV